MKFIVQVNYWTMGSSGDSVIMMQFTDVLHNMSLTVLLPWQQTAFRTFPDILGFSGHLWSSFWYLPMVLHLHDPASLLNSKVQVMALINAFQAENHCIIEIGLEETGKDWVANWEHIFYSHISVLPVEL